VGWHGREAGTVCLRERKLRVERPRLRKKQQGEGGEVPLPAYEAMRGEGRLGGRMLETLLSGSRPGRGPTPEGGDGGGIKVERE
jgi:putative transposase